MCGILTIDEIDLTDTLPLRSKVLRNGAPADQCLFLQDGKIDAAHFGLKENGEIVAIASFYSRPLEKQRIPLQDERWKSLINGSGVQLRGMAVTNERQNRGLGKILLNEALMKLSSRRSPQPEYFWCYAVETAIGFYERMDFVPLGERFEMPENGLLQTMVRVMTG